MFKKLMLCLVLVMALIVGPIGGGVYAMEKGQECTVLEGAKIIQILPDESLRGVTVPEDASITLGAKLESAQATTLNRATGEDDWQDAYMAIIEYNFGDGIVPLLLVVKPHHVKDCK